MKKKPAKKKARKSEAKPKPAARAQAKRSAKRSRAKSTPFTPKRPQTRIIDKRGAFLKAFIVCGSISGAAVAARVDRGQHYDWMKDPAYAARFQQAKIEAAQSVDDEIAERAMRGVYEPYVFQGKVSYPQEEVITPAVLGPRGGVITPERREFRDIPGALPFGIWKKSDTLLIHLSRGLMPEKYGWRGAVEVSGPQGGAIEIVNRLNAARARMAARKAATE